MAYRTPSLAFLRSTWFWLGAVVMVVGCTAVAQGRLDGKPAGTGTGGGGAGVGGDGEAGAFIPEKKGPGEACVEGPECGSGFCADGVCCDQVCDGPCVTCADFDLNGVCTSQVGKQGDCEDGEFCAANLTCTMPEGNTCADDGNCANGSVCSADGVCCDQRCENPCESCLESENDEVDGICGPTASDLDDQCSGTDACAQQGLCCGDAQVAPGGACDEEICTGGCEDNTCIIECDGKDACAGANIQCPAGFACEIICSGDHACADSIIACSADFDCDLTCEGKHTCESTRFNCSSGPCSVTCLSGDEPCNADGNGAMRMTCGTNACRADCQLDDADYNKPDVTCVDACSCDEATCL